MILYVQMVFGQTGFYSLNLPASARIAALGGYGVSQANGDLTIGYHNPAVLDSVDVGEVHFLYNPFKGGVNRLVANSQVTIRGLGKLAIGTNYLNYGEMDETDDVGNVIGQFHARDYVVYMGKAHTIGVFSLGANLKFAGSTIAESGGTAIMMDFGGVFRHPEYDFTIGLVAKNVGFVISDITLDQALNLPFDVELGTTFKPEHMPVRFSITASNLTQTYDDLFIPDPDQEPGMANQIFRYLNIGTAFVFGKNVEAMVGYNHRRREEMKLEQGAFGAGFSYGLMIKVKQIEIRYSGVSFHAAGGSSFVSLKTNTRTVKNIF